jgi:hypothetical protein
VEVDQRARLNFALTIGSNAESITVQGARRCSIPQMRR